jgi:hypothetical protein
MMDGDTVHLLTQPVKKKRVPASPSKRGRGGRGGRGGARGAARQTAKKRRRKDDGNITISYFISALCVPSNPFI